MPGGHLGKVVGMERHEPETVPAGTTESAGRSPERSAMEWFRELDRVVKVCRTYAPTNPIVLRAREKLAAALSRSLDEEGDWKLAVTAEAITKEGVPVARAPAGGEETRGRAPESPLPFLFYRDGIRGLTLRAGIPEDEVSLLVEALREVGGTATPTADLVTLLWQSNPSHLVVESVPVEQMVRLSDFAAEGGAHGEGSGLAFERAPGGSEIRASFHQRRGPQGLTGLVYGLEAPPSVFADPRDAYAALAPAAIDEVERLRAEWWTENESGWRAEAPRLVRRLAALDPSPVMRAALASTVLPWLVDALRAAHWVDAEETIALVREIDGGESLAGEALGKALAEVDAEAAAQGLAEGTPEATARFLAVAVALGRPAVPLVAGLLRHAEDARTRAAAGTALAYLAGDDPEALRPYVSDAEAGFAQRIAFVLGQIGGVEVAGLLEQAVAHAAPAVRRQAVQSLSAVPAAERVPILLSCLGERDGALVQAVLAALVREPDPRAAVELLERIESPAFDELPEGLQHAFFKALADTAGEEQVPSLEAMLTRGGWFARASSRRVGAAMVLAALDNEQARHALALASQSKSEAVRAACRAAMSRKAA